MKGVLAGIGALFYSLTAQAITWDFNEKDNTQGWIAQEGD